MDAIDSNVYYYSYSTLAQALAGAFGFLAAVVLYRLQALNGQLENIARNLIGDPRTFNMEPFKTLFTYHRWSLFVYHVKRDQEAPNPIFRQLNFIDLGAMDHANNQVLSIRRWFIIAMVMTMAEITFSLVALFLMSWFSHPALLGSLVFLGLLCLAAYMRLILLVLE